MKKIMCFILLCVLAGSSLAAIGDIWNAGEAYLPAINQADPNLLPWSYRQGQAGTPTPVGNLLVWDAAGQWGGGGGPCYVPNVVNEYPGTLYKNNGWQGWTEPNALGGHAAYIVRWTSPVAGMIHITGYAVQTIAASAGDPRVIGFALSKNGVKLSEGHVPYTANGGNVNDPVYFEEGTGGISAVYQEVAVGDTIDVLITGNAVAGSPTGTFSATGIVIEQIDPASIVYHDLTIAANPAYINTLDPDVGTYAFIEGEVVSISATADYWGDCPTSLKSFDHWEGDVNDINAAATYVVMDADKTVTAVFADSGTCPPIVWDVNLDWDTAHNPFQTGPVPAWTLIQPETGLPYPLYGPGGFGANVWGPNPPDHRGLTISGWGACTPSSGHILGHGPWTVRWTSPIGGWVTIYAKIAQLWDITRRNGIDITKNGDYLGTAVVPSLGNQNTVCLYQATNPGAACTPLTPVSPWVSITLTRLVAVGDVIDFACTGNYPNSTGVPTFVSSKITVSTTDAPPQVDLTINVLTSPDAATDPDDSVITPGVGTFSVPTGETVNLSAGRFVQCPEVLEFAEWIGDVADTQSADTTILMNESKTVTVVYADARACPDECHAITATDLDGDCMTDIADLAIFAQGWLVDNRLSDDGLPY